MSGKSQRDLVLREEIHIVLHGHTIQRWTSLRYIISINLKGLFMTSTQMIHLQQKGDEFETLSAFSVLCQVIPPITIPLNLNVS